MPVMIKEMEAEQMPSPPREQPAVSEETSLTPSDRQAIFRAIRLNHRREARRRAD
ncbi:hypothetical protein MNBD_ALPHA04-1384 [hydrothermal vent metagenome]|uniref:Uncharacterized protein n=1 Tax=hydrothermal vent metagenome TaxID=652676 RepID=A0A3B0SM41_9ZZZZ